MVLHSTTTGIYFRRLPEGFWNIGVFIEQRGAGGHRGGHNPPGRALVGCAPLGAPPGASPAHWMSSGPKKSTKSFTAFGLRLVFISCDVKNMQKTATDTWHYVNRLVPKNDIK